MSDSDQATADDSVVISGFSALSSGALSWYCDPALWEPPADPASREGRDGSWKVCNDGKQLVVAAPAKKDFWRKTYYDPILVKDDGPCLFATFPATDTLTLETSFTLEPRRQFDQAGLCVRFDHEHWIKTGIEVVDGVPRLSCVVCNVYADWSTQVWPEPRLRIRVHVLGNSSFVVEAAPFGTGDFAFIRIAHLSRQGRVADDPLSDHPAVAGAFQGPAAPPGQLWLGLFACCPEDQEGASVTFEDFSIKRGTSFEHNADGNH